jgi:hypothetical protein
MKSLLAGVLALANVSDYTEARRVSSPTVYVGTVAELRKVGSLSLTGAQGSRMEATLKGVKVLRGAPPAAGAAAEGVVRYDQWEPPLDGGVQYRLAVGEVVVVFTRSLETDYPAALVNGTPKVVGENLRARRGWLAALDPDALRAQGLTEAQRPEQVKLYDRMLEALGLPLQ